MVRGSTWNADENDLLALPLLAGVQVLGNAAGSWVLIGDRSPLEVDILGELVAGLKRHCDGLVGVTDLLDGSMG